MCGITGFLDFNRRSPESTLRSMTDVLRHRGPDDNGYFYDSHSSAYIGLGHRRLSILDLSPHGRQPMEFEKIVITYNGEVYNFSEIRNELVSRGYVFDSNTDTEVILKAYHLWGAEMVHKLNGMFAFVIYDKPKEKLFLCRDRAGVKPLYWYFKNGLFLFSSELKSFHCHPDFQKALNMDGLALFLQYGYIPQPHTIFDSSFKLRGGYYLTVDLKKETVNQTKYWDVMDYYKRPKLDISEQEAVDETEKIFKSAFNYRMIADVPVGMFLSGGYDSSVVTAILQSDRTEKLKTFTIGFHEQEYNEAHYAKEVAQYLGTDHTEYYCTKKDAADIFPQLVEIWDEPFGDASAIPTVLVSRLARSRVAVSLSADGGDELFGGYDKYGETHKRITVLSHLPPGVCFVLQRALKNHAVQSVADICGIPNAKDRLTRLAYMFSCKTNKMLSFTSSSFDMFSLKDFLNDDYKIPPTDFEECLDRNWIDDLLSVDYKTYQIDDILTKVDRATMSVSLEGREPLLDYRIIDFVSRLDPSLKIRKGEKKYLLKQIAHKYIPKNLLDRPKMGFGVPVFEWFKDELKEYLLFYLSESKLMQDNIFNAGKVIDLRDRYLAGKKIFWSRLWHILVFQMWKEKWL